MLRWTLLLIFIVKIVFSEPNTTDAIKVIKLYSNASQDLEIQIKQQDKSQFYLNLQQDIELNQIEVTIEQLMSTHPQPGFLFFENYPNESFQIARCIKKSPENKLINNLSELDKLSKKFDAYFNKKSFIMHHIESIQNVGQDPYVIGHFQCRGLLLQDKTKKMGKYLNIREAISNSLTKFLHQELVLPQLKQITPFVVNPRNYFTATVYLHGYQVQALSFIQKFSKQDPFLIQKGQDTLKLNLKFFTKITDYNRLHLIKQKQKNQISVFYNENTNKSLPQQLITVNEKVPLNMPYRAQVQKTLFGAGLHQNINFQLKLNISKQFLSNEFLQGNCKILLVDFLEDSQYIDIEEFRELPDEFVIIFLLLYNKLQKSLRLEKIIDIEHPSFDSIQHPYIITYEIQPKDKISTTNNLFLNVKFNYPIHFRYRTPIRTALYKESHIYPNPKIFFNCFNFQTQTKLKQLTGRHFYTNFIHSKVSQSYYEIQADTKHEGSVIASTPVGNPEHNQIISFITFAMNSFAACIIGYFVFSEVQIISKKKK